MLRTLTAACFVLILYLNAAVALYCYRCVSTQPGCGQELSIRLEKWHWCPDTGPFGGENFCVKLIEKIGSDEIITRDCLMTFRHSERHREKIPTVQRQNYCQPGRNNDPKHPYDKTKTFCFCNDQNGCNGAIKINLSYPLSIFLAVSVLWIYGFGV